MYNLTDWLSGTQFPIYHGVYEKEVKVDLKCNPVYLYSYWNGDWWGYCSITAEDAFKNKNRKSVWQCTRWRGLNAPRNIGTL